uniref:ATP synthase F0 subunit 8 n=1 Tax=Stichophanes ningshaanensis TaxID=1484901 RepID=A0A0A7CR65_9SAUR|nr:ATP synthase F0 subunit 8 [Stichophanes ningshaanensis]AIH00209.1 ATP synthase F0 subunit 8 [Stichophanes ningshaanensis]
MPQLDTVYIFAVYLWTWFVLHLASQKIKTLHITMSPKKQQHKNPIKLTPTLPWT